VAGWVRNYTFNQFNETVTFKAPYFCCKTSMTETPSIDSGLFTNVDQTKCATNPTTHNSNFMKVSYFYYTHFWPWSYGSWIYNYLCNQCLSPLMLWVRISIRARYTTLCDKVCQWLATGRWFSPGPLVSSTNKTDCHDITEILLKVALNTIKKANNYIHSIKLRVKMLLLQPCTLMEEEAWGHLWV
jgi:hypothetical protein